MSVEGAIRHSTVDGLAGGVQGMFAAYDAGTLERVWYNLLKRCNQVLEALGGGEFEAKHTGTAKRQRDRQFAKHWSKSTEAFFNAAVDWWIDGEEETETWSSCTIFQGIQREILCLNRR